METLTEKYKIYKNSQLIQKNYVIFKHKGKLFIECKNCGKSIQLNGCTSHYKKCKNIYNDKFNFIINNFSGHTNSIISGNKINLSHDKRLDRLFIVVSDSKEWAKLNNYIYMYENYFKKCKECGKEIISKKDFCSISCSIRNRHRELKLNDYDKYLIKNLKISETRKKLHLKKDPWNKNLKGHDYLKHYIKNGVNTLYNGISKNDKWFLKTSIEEKMEELLNELNVDFVYNFFNETQIDFRLEVNNRIIFLETDGDYWNKSSRRCKDIKEIEMKRKEDTLKENNIIRKFNNSYFIRFWEFNINNNLDEIKRFLKDLISSDDTKSFEEIIKNIKEYYIINS